MNFKDLINEYQNLEGLLNKIGGAKGITIGFQGSYLSCHGHVYVKLRAVLEERLSEIKDLLKGFEPV